jgi:hypothetical protein
MYLPSRLHPFFFSLPVSAHGLDAMHPRECGGIAIDRARAEWAYQLIPEQFEQRNVV